MFRDELDMLQCRLEELADSVHRFILVEATQNHQGQQKPLHFAENRDRFAPWADRIIHVVVNDLPDNPNPWVREHAQRDAALATLEDADGCDLVLIGDLDEIPSRAALEAKPRPAVALQQNVCMFAVDWMAFAERTSVIETAAYARVNGLAAVRDQRHIYPAIRDGGWHFSWLGGKERCLEKLDNFCHLEARETVRQGIESGDYIERGAWNPDAWMRGSKKRDVQLEPVEVDERWPAMIREHRCPPEWYRPRAA